MSQRGGWGRKDMNDGEGQGSSKKGRALFGYFFQGPKFQVTPLLIEALT